MKLALVVPALNEQDAIGGTLHRCLDARAKVVSESHIDEMVIVFVNDGSTDRTQEIVDQSEFNEVVKVRFEKNKGYGAAIKAGYEATDADLVGFIDGDGTCNPEFCINLLGTLKDDDADVVLAARLSPESEMPFIRKLGNTIFAKLLGFMAGDNLTDSASGFRIIKRTSLKLMTPLPDGLHYTPAMSAICMLDPRLKISEVHGMKYAEREGRSKLSVVKDGVRFLSTIMFAACCYSPIKTMVIFSLLSIVAFLCMGFLGAPAASLWLAGGAVVGTLLAAGAAVHQLNYLLIGPRAKKGPLETTLQKILRHRQLMIGGGIACIVGGILLTMPQTMLKALGMFGGILPIWLCIGGALSGVVGVICRVVWAVGKKQNALVNAKYQVDLPNSKNQSSNSQTTDAPSNSTALSV
jgi:hypothetical protein